jgi:tetratricopeptide (TPR) repeat protein
MALAASRADAEDPQAEAQRLFEEGKKLLAEQRYETAIVIFQRVLAVYPSVGAYYNIGEAYERLDRPVAAWAAYVEAERMAHTKLDPREKDAHAKSAELEPRLPKLVVRAHYPELLVTIKDPVPPEKFNQPLERGPGDYELVARAPCKLPSTTRIHISEDGRSGDIVLPALADDPSCLPPPPDPGAQQRWIGYGLAGGGAVAAALGSVFGLIAISSKSDLDRECGGDYRHCNSLDHARTDDLNASARTQATVSTIGFVAAGVLLAAAATVIFTAPARPTRTGNAASASALTRRLEGAR